MLRNIAVYQRLNETRLAFGTNNTRDWTYPLVPKDENVILDSAEDNSEITKKINNNVFRNF